MIYLCALALLQFSLAATLFGFGTGRCLARRDPGAAAVGAALSLACALVATLAFAGVWRAAA